MSKHWKPLFLITSIEGIISITVTVLLPADSGGFLGFSIARWALLLCMTALLVFNLCAYIISYREVWKEKEISPQVWNVWLFLAFLGIISISVLILSLYILSRTTGIFAYRAYLTRLLPFLLWLLLICLQSIPFVFKEGLVFHEDVFTSKKSLWLLIVSLTLGLVAFWILIVITGLGITPDAVGWGNPFVPVLGWQIALALVASLAARILSIQTQSADSRSKVISILLFLKNDGVILVLIWLLAVVAWLSQPVPPGFFATAGRLPNYEIYPYSDGLFYAKYAQTILVGSGFHINHIPPRPLYIVLLAAMTAMGQQDYSATIVLQTLILAWIPPVFYLMGKQLHSRAAGIGIALLMIGREFTSILTSPYTLNASNSKLFFSELPVMLAIGIFLYLVIRWLQGDGKRPLAPLLAGGVMGFAMLIRTQSIFILAPVFMVAFIVFFRRWKEFVKSTFYLILALMLTIAPWLWRNYQITGQIVFDHPDSQLGSMSARYSDSGEERLVRQPGESEASFNERIKQQISDYIYNHPLEVAHFIASHFINNEITGFSVLPVRSVLYSPLDIIIPQTAFWQQESPQPGALRIALTFAYLFFLAAGLGITWKRWHWIGWIPLFANLSYNFSNSLARNSGDRYLLPVDWVFYFYFFIGFFQVSIFFLDALGWLRRQEKMAVQSPIIAGFSKSHFPCYAILSLFLFTLIGASLPLSEVLIPQRYPEKSSREIMSMWFKTRGFQSSGLDEREITEFLQKDNSFILWGRAVYPRFYAAGEGEPLSDKTGFRILDYPRLVFLTISDYSALAILKISDSPLHFPHASDVIVLGCSMSNYNQVKAVAVLDETGSLYIADDFYPLDCSTIEE